MSIIMTTVFYTPSRFNKFNKLLPARKGTICTPKFGSDLNSKNLEKQKSVYGI